LLVAPVLRLWVAGISLALGACGKRETARPDPEPAVVAEQKVAPSPLSRPFVEEVAARLPPEGAGGRGEAWGVRRSAPYTSATLPERFSLSPQEIHQLRDDVLRWIDQAAIPKGDALSLYAPGVSTLDQWLHHSAGARPYPPNHSTYYELIHVGGLPVAAYRHDVSGRRLAQRVFYAEKNIPVCSVSFAADGGVRSVAHLSYDTAGRIKQVITLDERGEPLWGTCFAVEGTYARVETVSYRLKDFGHRDGHNLYEEDRIFRIEADGSRKEVNRGAFLWWITRQAGAGVKPLYPLPEGFAPPAFDQRGADASRVRGG
jgi:hypothetical protein